LLLLFRDLALIKIREIDRSRELSCIRLLMMMMMMILHQRYFLFLPFYPISKEALEQNLSSSLHDFTCE